jgi:hypothetical protein
MRLGILCETASELQYVLTYFIFTADAYQHALSKRQTLWEGDNVVLSDAILSYSITRLNATLDGVLWLWLFSPATSAGSCHNENPGPRLTSRCHVEAPSWMRTCPPV